MSYATEYLKKALLYDSGAKTLHLSQHITALGDARNALKSAFGDQDMLVWQVAEIEAPSGLPNQDAETEFLCLQGKTEPFSEEDRDVYLEFGLQGESVVSMVILVLLPRTWTPTEAFAQLPEDVINNITLTEATVVISHNLSEIGSHRTIHKEIHEDLLGYPLQNGMQIVAKTSQNPASDSDRALLQRAKDAGLPEHFLPNLSDDPYRIGIRGDLKAGWLMVEKWWKTNQAEGDEAVYVLDDSVIYAAGIATRYHLTDSDQEPDSFLLREIDFSEQPLILEAHLSEYDQGDGNKGAYPIRYNSRFSSHIPLGEATKALEVLLGRNSHIFEALEIELPPLLSLISFSYAPGEWVLLAFAAGDSTNKTRHLIEVGPTTLEEVDFTIQLPLQVQGDFTYLELEGKASFFGEHFRVRLRPWEFIEGGLENLETVNLGKLLQAAVPIDLPFGLDSVQLNEAWVVHTLGGKKSGTPTSTELRVRLAGEIDLIANAVQLQDIQIYATHNSDSESSFRLTAGFEIGPVKLFAIAGYDNGNWIFSGSIQGDDQGISLTEIVQHLVHGFGAAIPDEVPDIRLKSLSMEFHSATRYLEIQGAADWKTPDDVPVLGGVEQQVFLQLELSRDPQQGNNEASISLHWTFEKSGHSLSADVLIAKGNQAFALDYSVEDVSQPAKLSDLTNDIGLSEYIPNAVGDVLDDIFQVSSLSLNFTRPGNNFEIAWSRPLGKGILVMEYNQRRTDLKTAASKGSADRHVEVSWVGNTETDVIGINDLLGFMGQGDLLVNTESYLDSLGLEAAEGVIKTVKQILTFKHLGFEWSGSNKSNIFNFNALSTFSEGTKTFLTVYTGSKRGVIIGVSFATSDNDDGLSLDDLTFLPSEIQQTIKDITSVIAEVALTYAVFSTTQLNDFQPPVISTDAMLPSFARQGSRISNNPFGAGKMKLGQGVAVGVMVKFGPDSIVRKVIDLEKLYGQITVGAGNVAVQVAIPLGLKLDAGGGTSLALTSPVLQLKAGEIGVEIDIMGGLELRLFGQGLNLAGWLSLSEESLTGHIQIYEIPDFVPLPTGYLRGVQLVIEKERPLSLEVGLQFEPPGLELGASGFFAIYKNQTDKVYGNAVIVLEVVEEVPNPLYIEFSMEEMSLPVLLEAMTGLQLNLHRAKAAVNLGVDAVTTIEKAAENAEGLSNSDQQPLVHNIGAAASAAAATGKATAAAIDAVEAAIGHVEALMSKVELKDVRLYWADSIVNLPDGTTAMPGAGLRGKLSVFDWDAFAMLDFSMSGIPGVSGHFECEPIKIGNILRIWGDGPGIHSSPQTAEDFYKKKQKNVDLLQSGAKLPAANPAAVKDEGTWYLSPGGPVLHFSTRSSPFLHADLHAELFGILHSDIHAEITDEGFMFDLNITADSIATAELECHWWKKEGQLEAHGNIDISLVGDIGPIVPHISATKISLNTTLDASVSLIMNKEKFELTINGDFMYQGTRLSIPELKLTVSFSKLEDLAARVWEHIVQEAKHIFSDIIKGVVEVFEKGIKEVKAVATAAYDFGKTCFNEAEQEVAQISQSITAGFVQGAQKFNETTDELKQQAENIVQGIADKTAELAKPVLESAEKLEAQLNDIKADVEKQLKHLEDTVAAAVAEAAQYVLDVVNAAEAWVEQRMEEARRWVADKLQSAKEAVAQLLNAASVALADIQSAIDQLSKEIADIEQQLLNLLSDLEEAAEQDALAATRWAGGAADSVGGFVTSIF